MAMEPNSYSFFDGILTTEKSKDFYIKEDILFEILQNLTASEKKYAPFFQMEYNLGQYGLPFIDKMDIGIARKSCPLLAKDLVKEQLKRGLSSKWLSWTKAHAIKWDDQSFDYFLRLVDFIILCPTTNIAGIEHWLDRIDCHSGLWLRALD